MSVNTKNKDVGLMQLRSYQAEMLEESLKGNCVVVMDTGSGKTLIAQWRIMEELKQCRKEQICWFLAPSVALAAQQYDILRTTLPMYNHRLLSGSDNVDKWTQQNLWDAVLHDVHVVTSTPAILLDALSHGFVRMPRIALLIFDEAHRCMGKSVMGQIMSRFYHPLWQGNKGHLAPHILGLTASPVMRANVKELDELERVMCSSIKTPKLARKDLSRFVGRPSVTSIPYNDDNYDELTVCKDPSSLILYAMDAAIANYDFMEDPYIQELLAKKDKRSEEQLNRAITKKKTDCLAQLKSLTLKSKEVYNQLGGWAVHSYVRSCIAKATKMAKRSGGVEGLWSTIATQEYRHVVRILSKLPLVDYDTSLPLEVSDKFNKLIQVLQDESKTDRSFSAIIFVRQRAVAASLVEVLSTHSKTKDNFRVSSFVGSSTNSHRKTLISDLAEIKGQQAVLGDFRKGTRDIVVSTSVLEEGIDVPACRLVICWDPPENLVSFVQRRGRARQLDAKYCIFFAVSSPGLKQWESLEDKMIREYLADRGRMDLELAKEAANEEEDDKKARKRVMKVEATGALLTMENATSHLHHLCAKFSSPGIESRPEFRIRKCGDIDNEIEATVYIPLDIDPMLRKADSAESWKSEQAAKRDAAFVAYAALYRAGLVNQNLLPDLSEDTDDVVWGGDSHLASTYSARQRCDPWRNIAKQWSSEVCIHSVRLTIKRPALGSIKLILLLPSRPPDLSPVILYWNERTQYTVTAETSMNEGGTILDSLRTEAARRFTHLMLSSVHGGRMKTDDCNFPALFLPDVPLKDVEKWLQAAAGTREALRTDPNDSHIGVVRPQGAYGAGYILKGSTTAAALGVAINASTNLPIDPDEPYLQVIQLPKRRDFLHPLVSQPTQVTPAYQSTKPIAARTCKVDNLPTDYTVAALFVPCILHRYTQQLVAAELQKSLLAPLDLANPSLVLTALTKSSARESSNYERLEFLGDCILKLHVSLALMARNPGWPERKLTDAKSRMVSNQTLAKTCMEIGLDAYISVDAFTGAKWKPQYMDELLEVGPVKTKRELSMKTLADVVESIIGAAYLDAGAGAGAAAEDMDIDDNDDNHKRNDENDPQHTPDKGLHNALGCIRILITTQDWDSLATVHALLASTTKSLGAPLPSDLAEFESLMDYTTTAPPPVAPPPHLQHLERLLCYKFSNPSLLTQALTHSAHASHIQIRTYQRLEFLGDAILDYIITTYLFAHTPPIHHHAMHTARTACVNADFLAWRCMEASFSHTSTSIVADTNTSAPRLETISTPRYLWQYMQHSTSGEVPRAQVAAVAAHLSAREEVSSALAHGPRYPWAGLAEARAPKFMSDIVESVVGAVYVDSKGDMEACRRVVMRGFGVAGFLKRALSDAQEEDGLELLHPKEGLGLLAGERKVRYDVKVLEGHERQEAEGLECTVYVDETEVARVKGKAAVSHLEIETRAAERAVLEWHADADGLRVIDKAKK